MAITTRSAGTAPNSSALRPSMLRRRRLRLTAPAMSSCQKPLPFPWEVIGVIHYRESSGDFAGVLHNGQKIIGTGKKTTLIPAGRGPFKSWEEAAVDAIADCHPYVAKNTDWSIGNTLDRLEAYNGLAYRNKSLPSPYLWAGTVQYAKGKYVADGNFDPNPVDKQLGVAPILMKLREMAQPARGVSASPAPTPSPLPISGLHEPAKPGDFKPAGVIAAIIILAALAAAFFFVRF